MTRRRYRPARPDTLQLDIDSAADLVHFHRCLPWLSCICAEQGMAIRWLTETRSRSGRHWHVEIRVGRRLTILERIALQAILGSDRMRELCNWERWKCKSTHPILLIDATVPRRLTLARSMQSPRSRRRLPS